MNNQSIIVDPTEERVLVSTKKHWVNIIPVLLACAILAIIVLALPSAWLYLPDLRALLSGGALSVLMVAGMSFIILIALLSYWIYLQNRLVLTSMYVTQVNQVGLFNRTISRISLDKLQEVTARQHGPVAQMLGFGDIVIETAGEQENFVFTQVPHPQQLAHQIMQAHESLDDRPKPVQPV